MKLKPTHGHSRRASTTLRRLVLCAVTAGLAVGGSVSGVAANSVSGSPNWTAYLKGTVHNSYAPLQQAITVSNAAKIVKRWHDFPGVAFQASPTVADNAVFIGNTRGWFYKLKATTGAVLHRVFLGHQPKKTCGPMGIVSTATVANDPVTHKATVYVAAPNGYLYALQASNLAVEWRSVIAIPSETTSNYFDWSSPTIANGTIYIGVSSNCDNPLIRGGVIDYDQATGKKITEFYTVPQGDIGGSVWSSVAIGPGGDVYASTGNGPEKSISTQLIGDADSILKLAPGTLKLLGQFQVPPAQIVDDADFGASPVIVGTDVGACDKNGIFYMLSQATMQPVWEERVGSTTSEGNASCLAAPAVDTASSTTTILYLGAVGTTINGTRYRGSVQARDAATGAMIWETGLGAGVVGSRALDGAGVVTVPVYTGHSTVPSLDLVDAATGRILKGLASGDLDFPQAVFAENMLFSANKTGVYGWRPPS